MKGNVSFIAEEAYRLGKLIGYEEGAKYWKKEGATAERAAIVACLFAFAQSAEDEQVGRSDWAIIYRSAAEAIRDGAHEWIERGDHIQPEPTAPKEVHGDLDASPPPAGCEEGEE